MWIATPVASMSAIRRAPIILQALDDLGGARARLDS